MKEKGNLGVTSKMLRLRKHNCCYSQDSQRHRFYTLKEGKNILKKNKNQHSKAKTKNVIPEK